MEDKVLLIGVDDFMKGQHRIPVAEDILPFSSSSSSKVLRNNFPSIIGDLARSITGKEISSFTSKFQYHQDVQPLSNFIAESPNIEFEKEDDRVDFVRIVDAFLFEGKELKISHPYLYNLKMEEVNNSYFKNIASFMEQVFFKEESETLTIFQLDDANHVLMNLILNRLDGVMETKAKSRAKSKYANLLPDFTNLFIEDLRYLSGHREYFLNNLELFLNYYMFTYPIQLLVQFESFENAKGEIIPFYYALEWEKISKKRSVADPLKGYKFIAKNLPNLFVHQQVLQQLSINSMNKHNEVKKVESYTTLFKNIEAQGQVYEQQYIKDLQKWIVTYSNNIPNKKIDMPSLATSKEELVAQLFNQVSQGMSDRNKKNYGEKVMDLGVDQFLKQRGNLGYLFNMNYELLMLLTAVIVKDKPTPFKVVLEGFRRRGIEFDRHSIAVIIELFNKQNILDNKSDSGDAQYVKPIL